MLVRELASFHGNKGRDTLRKPKKKKKKPKIGITLLIPQVSHIYKIIIIIIIYAGKIIRLLLIIYYTFII